MKRNIFVLLTGILVVGFMLAGCGASLPTMTGLEPFNINTGLTEKTDRPYVVVDINSNEIATDGYEPYPAQPVVVWQSPEKPFLIKSRKAIVDDKYKSMMAIEDRESEEYKQASKEHQKAVENYLIVYNSWALSASPGKVQEFRAISIRFKDPQGRIVEPVENGKINVDPQVLSEISPYYGGAKRIIISNTTLNKLVEDGYRIAITSIDDSDQKHVFRLDGKGFYGEDAGTRRSSFSWVKHGVPFTADNTRIYEVQPGTEKDQEIRQWIADTTMKAAIIAFKNDAVGLGSHPGLEEFKNFALNPWDKRYIERKTSRVHAIWQVMSDWEIGPMFFTDFSSFGVGFGLWKGLGLLTALFSDRQFDLFGSAGQAVTRFDFYNEFKKVEKRDRTYEKANALVFEHNSLGVQYYRALAEKDQDRANILLKHMAEIAQKIVDKTGYLPVIEAAKKTPTKIEPPLALPRSDSTQADQWLKAMEAVGIKPSE